MFPFQFNKTSHYIVSLYVTEVGTIHLYQESVRRNYKYYNKLITRNVTFEAEYMQRKLNPFQKNDIAIAHIKFVIGDKSVSSLVNGGIPKSQLVSFSTGNCS